MSDTFSVPSPVSAFQVTQSQLSWIVCDINNSEICFDENSHLNISQISNPTQPPDFFELGINAWIFKDFDRAIVCFQTVVEMEPNTASAPNNIGLCLVELEKYSESLPYFDRAIEIKQDYHHAYYNKASALDLLEEFDQALTACNQAIQFVPDDRWGYYNLRTRLLLQLDRLEEALLESDRTIEIFERSVTG